MKADRPAGEGLGPWWDQYAATGGVPAFGPEALWREQFTAVFYQVSEGSERSMQLFQGKFISSLIGS